jgi:hypothetical protein
MRKDGEVTITTADFAEKCLLVKEHGFKSTRCTSNGVVIKLSNPGNTYAQSGAPQTTQEAGAWALSNVCHANCKFYDNGQLLGHPIGRRSGTCIPTKLKTTKHITFYAHVDQPPQPKKNSLLRKLLSFLE